MITKTYTVNSDFFNKALLYADEFSNFSYLNPNGNKSGFKHTLILGEKALTTEKDSFKQIKGLLDSINQTCHGFLSYDLKNEIEKLSSKNLSLIHI